MAKEVKIKVGLDTSEAKKAGRELNASLGADLKALALGPVGVAVLAFTALTKAISSVSDFMRDSVAAASEAEVANKKFGATLLASGQYTEQTYKKSLELASGIQSISTISEEATLSVQGLLLTYGVQTKELERATKATLGLNAENISMEKAVKLVAQALDGNLKPLAKIGIHATSSGDALEQLESKFINVVATGQTFDGRLNRISSSFGELQESLGNAVVQNSAINELFEETIVLLVGAGNGADDLSKSLDDLITNGIIVLLDGTIKLTNSLDKLVSPIKGTIDLFSALYDILERNTKIMIEFLDWSGATRRFLQDLQELGDLAFDKITGKGDEETIFKKMGDELEKAKTIAKDADLQALIRAANAGAFDGGPANTPAKKQSGGRGKGSKKSVSLDGLSDEAKRILSGDTFGEGIEDFGEASKGFKEAFGAPKNEAQELELETMRANADEKLALMEELHRNKMEYTADMNNEELAFALDFQQRERAQLEERNSTIGNLANQAVGGISNMVAGLAVAFASGDTIEMDKFFGQMITGLGTMLIQFGTAALLGGVLGTLVPFLAPMTGGPAGIAAGGAALAGGLIMVGIGSAMGGSTKGGGSARVPSVAGAGSTTPSRNEGSFNPSSTDTPSPFKQGEAGSTTKVINVSFSGFVGSKEETGRAIIDSIRSAEKLNGRPAFGG